MVSEILRINELPASVNLSEGSHGHVRIVHSDSHSSYTGWLDVTPRRQEELRSLQIKLPPEKAP